MCPETGGSPSPTMRSRTTERPPSAPIRAAAEMRSPPAISTATPLPSARKPVRRELDAGADLADLGRLLEHDDPEVAPRQRERHGEAANTATGDDHWPGIACCCHWNRL